jgi:hypothetical protein
MILRIKRLLLKKNTWQLLAPAEGRDVPEQLLGRLGVHKGEPFDVAHARPGHSVHATRAVKVDRKFVPRVSGDDDDDSPSGIGCRDPGLGSVL